MTTADRIAEAFAVQRQGDLPAAEAVYRSVLATEPDNVNALQLLGLICRATHRLDEAVTVLTAALNLRPDVAELYNNRGLCHLDQERYAVAEEDFREAIRRKGRYPEAWNNFGLALLQLGRHQEAEQAFTRALALQPNNPLTLCNLAGTLRHLKRLREAEACCRKALEIRPDYPEAENNLGMVLGVMDRHAEAEACFRRSLATMRSPRVLCNLAHLLRETGRPEEAAEWYQATLDLDPKNCEAAQYLANLNLDLGNLDTAEALCRKYKEFDPQPAAALAQLAVIMEFRDQMAEAERCRLEAIALDPQCYQALHDLGMQYLLTGRWDEGWPLMENRWRLPPYPQAPSPQPRWTGDSLAGKTILLWSEQGQGDTIQFVRYARQVRQFGARVVLLCPANLGPLLERCAGIDQITYPGEPLLVVDTHCPLLSLAGVFHTTPQTVPAEVPYLAVDAKLQMLWKERLNGLAGFKVGIVWRGNWKFKYDRYRSVSLSAFSPLANIPNVHLISLQKGRGSEEMATIGASLGIHDLGEDYQRGTFADTAAIVKNLDLVVSVDTAVAHLAGALAVPVWLANRRNSDWRWLLEGGRTPWYPTMRIFRQQQLGEWGPVFEAMGKFLRHRAARGTIGK